MFRETPAPVCGCYQVDDDRNPTSPIVIEDLKLLSNIPQEFMDEVQLPFTNKKQCYIRFNIFERPIDVGAHDQKELELLLKMNFKYKTTAVVIIIDKIYNNVLFINIFFPSQIIEQ